MCTIRRFRAGNPKAETRKERTKAKTGRGRKPEKQITSARDRSTRLEAAGKHPVELVGDFHAQRVELVVQVGGIVEIELVALGACQRT